MGRVTTRPGAGGKRGGNIPGGSVVRPGVDPHLDPNPGGGIPDQWERPAAYAPWFMLSMLPGYEQGMMQQGPGFSPGGMYDYQYQGGQVGQDAGSFGWQDMWGPMAQEMEANTLDQMANIREQAGMEGGKYSSGHLLAQQSAANQGAKDMNRVMSELQYKDRIAADERQRQLMMDMFGMGQQQQEMSNKDLEVAYNDWLRRANYGRDSAAMFLGSGYKPDSVFQPGQDNTGAYASAAAAIIGAMMMSSDEGVKTNIEDIDVKELLDGVKKLKIRKWSYNWDKKTTHVGPMAQDFMMAFAVGDDDRFIHQVDAFGVLLGAVQALAEKVERLEAKE